MLDECQEITLFGVEFLSMVVKDQERARRVYSYRLLVLVIELRPAYCQINPFSLCCDYSSVEERASPADRPVLECVKSDFRIGV